VIKPHLDVAVAINAARSGRCLVGGGLCGHVRVTLLGQKPGFPGYNRDSSSIFPVLHTLNREFLVLKDCRYGPFHVFSADQGPEMASLRCAHLLGKNRDFPPDSMPNTVISRFVRQNDAHHVLG
jgi:hypothetical protein